MPNDDTACSGSTAVVCVMRIREQRLERGRGGKTAELGKPLLANGHGDGATAVAERDAALKRWRVITAGLAIIDLILTLATCFGTYGGSRDFFRDHARGFSFVRSLLDVFIIAIIRSAAVLLSAMWSSRLPVICITAGFDAAFVVLLVVKAAMFKWHRDFLVSSAPQAIMAVILTVGLLELPTLYLLAQAVRRNRRKYSKLLNGDFMDVEGAAGSADATAKKEDPLPPLTVTQLLRILKPYFWPSTKSDDWLMNRVRCISTWVFVTGSKVSSVFSPIFLARATTSLTQGDLTGATTNAAIYCVLAFGSKFLKECQNLIYLEVKRVAYAEIVFSTFEHLLNLSLQWHLKKKMGQVIRAMDRGTDAADTIVTYLFLYLVPAVGECIAVCVIFLTHFGRWDLSLLLFVSLVLFGFATVKITLWRKKFREKTNAKDNEIHERATDSLTCFETVKCFTNEQFELKRFREAVTQYQTYSITTQASLSLLNIIQQAIVQGCCAGTLIITAKNVINGDMAVGDFIAVNAYTTNAFAPLGFLGTVYTVVIKALVDMQNLNQLLLEKPDIVDKPHAPALPPPIKTNGLTLSFDNVSFNYPEQPVDKGLKSVSFHVPAGTTTALVGHTGSGKTTSARLLFRFYDPREGRVMLNGVDIRDVTQQSVRGLIGVVPQDTVLFNDTLLHNIRYGRLDATFEEVEAAAEAAQLKPFIESLPDKYESMVGERGLKLSGGEKQRVAIARCLLKDPPMVLLDEATSALDTRTERGIQEALARLRQNRTTVIIAHRLSTITHADQIIVLDNGRIKEKGSHDELLRLGGTYASLWKMQAEANKRGEREGGSNGVSDELTEPLSTMDVTSVLDQGK